MRQTNYYLSLVQGKILDQVFLNSDADIVKFCHNLNGSQLHGLTYFCSQYCMLTPPYVCN